LSADLGGARDEAVSGFGERIERIVGRPSARSVGREYEPADALLERIPREREGRGCQRIRGAD